MMNVYKMTAHDGRVFYDTDGSDENIKKVCGRLGGLYQIDIIEMTEDEYMSIPTTSEAAALFA